MGMTDPIADMLTRIRNGQSTHKASVDIPASKMKNRIGEILVEEGYLKSVEVIQGEGSGGSNLIRAYLKYYRNKPVIEIIERKSTPGRRIYVGKEEIPSVFQGLGVAVLSTSKGVLSSRAALKEGVGGELLFTVF